MHRVLVLGAGKIGALIGGLLAESGDYAVDLVDVREGTAASVAKAHGLKNVTPYEFDAGDAASLAAHLAKHQPTRSCRPCPTTATRQSRRRHGTWARIIST